MRDSESEYPLHQPRRNRDRGPFDENSPDFEEQPRPRPRRRLQRPLPEYDVSATSELPEGRLGKALEIGAIAGVLCTLVNVIIVLVNASTYQRYNPNLHDPVNNALSFSIFGYWVVYSLISLLICFIAGIITGRVAVERRLGFATGFIAGVIYYAAIFLITYIPGYPDHYVTTTPVSAGAITGGIIFSLILLIVYGVIGGILGRLGAGLATRRHPYYVGDEE